MSRDYAHQILDDAIAGLYVHPDLIRRALQATGDLSHEWPVIEDEE